MGAHDEYGKRVLLEAAGTSAVMEGKPIEVDYGAGQPARIDGAVAGQVAVEIESRVSKQVRGALMDLIFHPFPKKLVVLVPVHMSNPETTAKQCQFIMRRFSRETDFRVVLLMGSGIAPRLDTDSDTVRTALRELGA